MKDQTPWTLGVKAEVVQLLGVLCVRGSHQKVPRDQRTGSRPKLQTNAGRIYTSGNVN